MFKRKRSFDNGSDGQMQPSLVSDLPYSRTMKRTRDRPSEETIHQRTLDLLSKGAVLDMHAPKTLQDAQAPLNLSQNSSAPAAARPQRSLHSFWNLPAAPSSAPANAPVVIAVATLCDNCKGPLHGNGTMDQDCCDVVASYNPADLPDSACGQCRRNVCDLCSVSRIDGPRMCFGCLERGGRPQMGGPGTTGKTPFQRMWG